jgi:hypothetical protein
LPASRFVLAILLIPGLLIFGVCLTSCDNPQANSTAQAANSSTTKPAADPPSSPVSLVSIPVLVMLPPGWAVAPAGNENFLAGPAPDGPVRISLSMLDSMDTTRREHFIAGAIDQAQKHPQRIQIHQSTSRNGLQLLERVTYSSADGIHVAQLSATTTPSDKIAWSLILFVPYRDRFIPCSFDLLSLTQDQYRDDQQFIETIIDSAQAGKLSVAQ